MSNQRMEGGENPYLEGNFAPIIEEVTATNLQVEGELPQELNGRYLRNGPNPLILRQDRTTTGLSVLVWHLPARR